MQRVYGATKSTYSYETTKFRAAERKLFFFSFVMQTPDLKR